MSGRERKAAARELKAATRELKAAARERKAAAFEQKAAAAELKAATREREAATREREAAAREREAAARYRGGDAIVECDRVGLVAPPVEAAAPREARAPTAGEIALPKAPAREAVAAAPIRTAAVAPVFEPIGTAAVAVAAVPIRTAAVAPVFEPIRTAAVAPVFEPIGTAAVAVAAGPIRTAAVAPVFEPIGTPVVAPPEAPTGAAAVVAPPEQPSGPRRGRSRIARLAYWSPAFVVLLAAAALGAWMLGGGRMLVMRTPSMGTTAPTGSMVLTRKLGSEQLHRGMLIAFRVPNTGEVYMHRIARIEPSGLIRTRGDLDSADDGWVLTRSAIVGVPVMIVPVLGWLLLAAPWAIGVLVVGFGVARLLPRRLRAPLRSATVGGAIALPLLILRPFVRVSLVSAGQSHGQFFAHLVNGGLMPLNVALRSTHALLAPGHAVTITAAAAGKTLAHLTAHPALSVGDWTLFALFALVPALGAGVSRADERSGAHDADAHEPGVPVADRSQLTVSPGTVSR